jgi:putative transposase
MCIQISDPQIKITIMSNNRSRRSIRLKGYDYSADGAYFITICVRHRECLLGEIHDGQMILNECGSIVRDVWNGLPDRVSDIDIDEYVIMPNHFHAIILINKSPESTEIHKDLDVDDIKARRKMILPKVVGRFKMLAAKTINQSREIEGLFWQRNYYERVIRSEKDCQIVRQYIINNPVQWEMDEHYPISVSKK